MSATKFPVDRTRWGRLQPFLVSATDNEACHRIFAMQHGKDVISLVVQNGLRLAFFLNWYTEMSFRANKDRPLMLAGRGWEGRKEEEGGESEKEMAGERQGS